nr:hydrogenase [Pyrinomonadaceae bacterium]
MSSALQEQPHEEVAESKSGYAVIAPGHTFASVTDKIASIVLRKRTPFGWFIGVAIGFMIVQMLMLALTWLLLRGTGIWGINVPVGWGFAII